MSVLRDYHAALGELVFALRGDARALRRRRSHGVLQRPAAVPGRTRSEPCGWPSTCETGSTPSRSRWRRHGHELGFGVGIAQGYATLGRVGFEGRWDYAAIGTVTNVAARLCDVAAAPPDPDQPAGAGRTRRALRDAPARAARAARHLAAPSRSTRSSAPSTRKANHERQHDRPDAPDLEPADCSTTSTRRLAGSSSTCSSDSCPRCGGFGSRTTLASRSSSCHR